MRPKGYLKDNPKTADLVPQFALSDMISWYCHGVDGIILFFDSLPVFFWNLWFNNIERNCLFEACWTGSLLFSPVRHVKPPDLCMLVPESGHCVFACSIFVAVLQIEDFADLLKPAWTMESMMGNMAAPGWTWAVIACYCNIDLVTTSDCCVSQESRSCSCNMVFWCFLDSSRSLKFTLQQTRSREGNSCLQYTSQRTSSDMGIWVCLIK